MHQEIHITMAKISDLMSVKWHNAVKGLLREIAEQQMIYDQYFEFKWKQKRSFLWSSAE